MASKAADGKSFPGQTSPARSIDSATGCFLTRDPIQDGRNWYAYCNNDPVGFADPSGNQLVPFPLPFPKLPKVHYPNGTVIIPIPEYKDGWIVEVPANGDFPPIMIIIAPRHTKVTVNAPAPKSPGTPWSVTVGPFPVGPGREGNGGGGVTIVIPIGGGKRHRDSAIIVIEQTEAVKDAAQGAGHRQGA